jgi:hypothetical protein
MEEGRGCFSTGSGDFYEGRAGAGPVDLADVLVGSGDILCGDQCSKAPMNRSMVRVGRMVWAR